MRMASFPPEPILSEQVPDQALAQLAGVSLRCDPPALVEQWRSLHAQAARLGALAQIAPEAGNAPFARLIAESRDWQRVLVAQGLADIDAMLVPGLSALATLTARGQDATTPALALWREFHAARGSVLAALGQSQTD